MFSASIGNGSNAVPAKMRVALIVAAVPHYFLARVCALQRGLLEPIIINSGSAQEFYSIIGAESQDLVQVMRLKGGRRRDVFRQTTELLDEVKPDVVAVAGWAEAASFAGLIWAKRNKKALVFMSDSQEIDAKRTPLKEYLKSRIVKCGDAALVAGIRHKSYLIKLGFSPDDIELGYDVVDNKYFEAGSDHARSNDPVQRQQLGLPKRYILAAARFIAKKNLPNLIKAYGMIVAKNSSAPDLVVLGEGPDRELILKTAASLGVSDRVHLIGLRAYSLLPAIYGLSEGFVHLSTSEQWGLVINEAAASGLPLVISKPCGAAPELVRERINGWLVDPADMMEMTAALAGLLSLSADQRRQMGAESRKIVSNWGLDRFVSGLTAACMKAVEKPRTPLSLFNSVLVWILVAREMKDVA